MIPKRKNERRTVQINNEFIRDLYPKENHRELAFDLQDLDEEN